LDHILADATEGFASVDGVRFCERRFSECPEEDFIGLVVVGDERTHGYCPIEALKHVLGLAPSPGTVSPTSAELEADGVLDTHQPLSTTGYWIADQEAACDRIEGTHTRQSALGENHHRAPPELRTHRCVVAVARDHRRSVPHRPAPIRLPRGLLAPAPSWDRGPALGQTSIEAFDRAYGAPAVLTSMHRRRVLGAATAAIATAVASCLDGSPVTGDETVDPTDEPTVSPSPNATERTLEETSFTVTAVECGREYGSHDVTTSGDTVTVAGVLDGRDTCDTAKLVRGEYASEADTLHVEVEVDERPDASACAQCIVEVHYTATFEFDDGTPERIEVAQRGATKSSGSTNEHGSGSATAPGAGTATPTASADDGY
jgi:hypothetical protein